MADDPLIRFDDVHKAFGEKRVLEGMSLEVQPGGWQALQHLAWRDAKSGRLGRALKRARAALKANRDAPYANLVLGVAMHERGRSAAARAGYARFLKHCKGCPETGEIRRVLRSMSEEE